jgi:hypothetical protein
MAARFKFRAIYADPEKLSSVVARRDSPWDNQLAKQSMKLQLRISVNTDSTTRTFEIAPMVERSQAAFRRDLPDLMKTHYRLWVAYHGDERIGFGRDKVDLYHECLRRGLNRHEFVVRSVEPEMPDEIDPQELMNT